MRLLNASSLKLESFSSSKTTPPYAILSHTWGKDDDEVSFQDMQPDFRSRAEKKLGYEKVKMTCELALKENLDYVWIDTCCIDKSSSAELSESINSMFKWYHQAVVCFAWLVDWEPDQKTFAHCKWFTRGWTLQEMVASKIVIFYDRSWQARGTKSIMSSELSSICGITESVLNGKIDLADVPIAVRMSWAANRTTTREEDLAYCLLGIFDINMPMLYGEGNKAFQRLQEEIIKSSEDISIFAWRALDARQSYVGILAPSPKEFQGISELCPEDRPTMIEPELRFSVSNRGLELNTRLELDVKTGCFILPVLRFDFPSESSMAMGRINLFAMAEKYGVFLRRVGLDTFVRELPTCLSLFDEDRAKSEYHSVRVFKGVSAQASNHLSRREIYFRHSMDLEQSHLGLVKVPGPDASTSHLLKLVADHSYVDECLHHFIFTPTRDYDSPAFTLLCYFKNSWNAALLLGHWRCGLVRGGGEWQGSRLWANFPNDILSSSDATSGLCRTLLIPHTRDSSRTEQVILTLNQKHVAETGDTRVYIDLRLEDKGDRSKPSGEREPRRPVFLRAFKEPLS